MGARDSFDIRLGSAVDRVRLLTDAQKACLRGVLAHLTSRQIARELGVSPHTVDGHLRAAMQRLGVQNRTEAALLLAAMEDRFPQPHARDLAHPPPAGVADRADCLDSEPFADVHYARLEVTQREQERNISYTSGHREQGLLADRRENDDGGSQAGNLRGVRRNERDAGQRLLLVLLVSFGSALMFAALVLSLSALNDLWS
jgi:DNA-binding CsgD family transcriptional regulator